MVRHDLNLTWNQNKTTTKTSLKHSPKKKGFAHFPLLKYPRQEKRSEKNLKVSIPNLSFLCLDFPFSHSLPLKSIKQSDKFSINLNARSIDQCSMIIIWRREGINYIWTQVDDGDGDEEEEVQACFESSQKMLKLLQTKQTLTIKRLRGKGNRRKGEGEYSSRVCHSRSVIIYSAYPYG